MKKDYSEILTSLSLKMFDLVVEIHEYLKTFPLDDDVDNHDTNLYYLVESFENNPSIIDQCKLLQQTTNTIVNLKDECETEKEKQYCLYIGGLAQNKYYNCDNRVEYVRYRNIKFDDFCKYIFSEDIEGITIELNERMKEYAPKRFFNVEELTSYTHPNRSIMALLYDLRYISSKRGGDENIDCYHGCFYHGNLLLLQSYDEVFETNYLIFSNWVRDFKSNAQLYKKFYRGLSIL
jgi:hypothetical protein